MIDVIPFAKKLKLVTSTPYIDKLYKMLFTFDWPNFRKKGHHKTCTDLTAEKYLI